MEILSSTASIPPPPRLPESDGETVDWFLWVFSPCAATPFLSGEWIFGPRISPPDPLIPVDERYASENPILNRAAFFLPSI